ncbi:type II secretion system protein GspK [Piscinibacter sakaiensis]|uniref:General secretion pathway protein K n=1 Tax=Piscinibacter sakaiensis TaxID=1547922 RepID=A0A0K8NV94_PISS1|nr:type II secretion system protein GspK [Piscinibacter sakaiensis]GAP33865.1 general secretion pathway protein K [Piscinibacter sakaiensis]
MNRLDGGRRAAPRAGKVSRGPARGFALVIVLWVLAGLTVVAVTVASSARVGSEGVKLLRDRVAGEAAFLSAGARIAVIAATGSPTADAYNGPRGRLPVDGQVIGVDATTWATVRDVRGLVNLNSGATLTLERLLRGCGATEQEAARLSDALGDYIDEDDLKRLNGAEAFDYGATDLPRPRNQRLASREELWRVLGWPALRSRWEAAGCDEWVTVNGDGLSNRSTAPAPVLVAFGLDDAAVRRVQQRRDGVPAGSSPATAEVPAGGELSLAAGGVAGKTLRVALRATSVEWATAYELELTPDRPGGPWRLREMRHPPQVGLRTAPPSAARLPAVDYQPSPQELPATNAPSRLPFGN